MIIIIIVITVSTSFNPPLAYSGLVLLYIPTRTLLFCTPVCHLLYTVCRFSSVTRKYRYLLTHPPHSYAYLSPFLLSFPFALPLYPSLLHQPPFFPTESTTQPS